MKEIMSKEDVDRRIDEMRERLELIIAANDRRYDERNEQNLSSRAAAYSAINTRLDGMNEFRAALSDQMARGVSRTEHDTLRDVGRVAIEQAKDQLSQQMRAEVGPLRTRIDEIGRPNWTLLVSSMSVIALIIGGMWLVIGLRIDASVAPLLLSNVALTNVTDIHTKSIQELRRIDAADEADTSARDAKTSGRLVQVETQICDDEQLRNIARATDLRTTAMLWQKVFPGSTYPTDNSYYPQTICKH